MLESVTLVAYGAGFLGLGYVAWTGMMAFLAQRRKLKIVNKIPHSPDYHWFFGHVFNHPGPNVSAVEYLRQKVTELPRLGLFFLGPLHYTVTVRHPETIKGILKTTEPKPLGLGGYKCARPWFGDGLVISKGAKWARNRRLLTPAFHFDVLKPYVAVKNNAVELLLEKWERKAESGEYMEVFSEVSLCTLDIILRCAFSYENDCQTRGDQHPYVKAVSELGKGVMERVLKPWLNADRLYFMTSQGRKFKANCDYVHKFACEIITNRRKAIAASGGVVDRNRRYLDFLDILLTAKDEEGVGLTDKEIRDEADTFLVAGHDTTSSSISWTLHELALHPEHLHRCQQEVDTILDGRPDDTLQWEDLSKLKYLTMCIKEAMRLRSPVPVIQRETTKEMEIDGYTIPSGTILNLSLYNVHHNPTVWEDPEEYHPSRFLPENMEKMDPYAFIPFAAGPRNCIGQQFAMHEQKVLLARIIRRFDLEMDAMRPAQQVMSTVMRSQTGMMMKVKPRST